MPSARKTYLLTDEAIGLVGALARPLALWPSAIGRSFSGRPSAAKEPGVLTFSYDPDGDEDEDEDENEDDEDASSAAVALVRIEGPLAQKAIVAGECEAAVDGYDQITSRLRAALSSKARAVILSIDSPGGDGAGLFEAVRRMRAMVDGSGKPCLAYVNELAASAAYWLAAGVAKDGVLVPKTGAVGSIGAIAVHADYTGAAELNGVKYTVIRSPEGKAAGTSVEVLSETGHARIKRDVDALASMFTAAISQLRGIDEKALRKLDADVLSGEEAVAAKLADGVATLEETISRAIALADERRNAMGLREDTAALVGAPSSASDAELSKTVQAASPIMNLGRLVMTLANSADPVAATKAVASAFAAAAREEAEKPNRQAAEDGKRVSLLQAFCKAEPGRGKRVMTDPAGKIEMGNLAPLWASMPIEQLEAVVGTASDAAAEAPKHASATAPKAASSSDGELTAEDLDFCRKAGVSASDFKAFKAKDAARAAERVSA